MYIYTAETTIEECLAYVPFQIHLWPSTTPPPISVYFVLLPLAPRLRIFVYADSSRIPRRGEIDRAPKMCKQCFEDRSIVHSRSFARSSEKSFNIRRSIEGGGVWDTEMNISGHEINHHEILSSAEREPEDETRQGKSDRHPIQTLIRHTITCPIFTDLFLWVRAPSHNIPCQLAASKWTVDTIVAGQSLDVSSGLASCLPLGQPLYTYNTIQHSIPFHS